jgi:hypothetical protein
VSVTPTYRAIATGVGAVLLLFGAFLAVPVAAGPPTSGDGSEFVAGAPTAAPCPGPLLPHNYSGSVAAYDTVAPSSISLRYTFDVSEVLMDGNGSVLSSACDAANGTVAGSPEGGWNLSIYPTPVVNCSVTLRDFPCLIEDGPYEAVNVSVASALPAGDLSSIEWTGTAFAVDIYPYLATVQLVPGPAATTFSPGATDAIRAEALTGVGNATPMEPDFAWSLSGSGWSFAGPPGGPVANVTAVPGAGVANLSVVASLAVGGTTLVSAASESLLEIPTTVSAAGIDRTIVDVGQPIALEVNGTGAAGYAYDAIVRPGLDALPTVSPCTSVPSVDGTVSVSCAATVSYSGAGVAQPSMTVTNGASAATWTFPDVTVHPDPALAFDPAVPVGYAGVSFRISVDAANGTGADPYSRACLSTGLGATECDVSPGPTWAFSVTYPATGEHSVTAWAVDASGTNVSVSTSIRIVPVLEVSVGTAPANASVGTPLTLFANVSGGDLPGRVWWNATGGPNPIDSAEVGSDGLVTTTFDPSTPGFATVTVTVVDDLGTAATATETFAVGAGPATQAVASGLPPSSAVRAGEPFGIAWQALDAGGDPVHDFAASALIELAAIAGGTVAGAVNASGLGPLSSPLTGWFEVPTSAWVGGALNVSVSVSVATPIEVRLVVASGLPSGADSVPVTVLPDIDHLVLSAPQPALSSDRAGATLYTVRDRFGNPATGASLVVTESWAGTSERTVVPVLTTGNGSTEAWVNYSIPGDWAGAVLVTDLAGGALLASISVAGLSGALAGLGSLPLLVALAAGAAVGGAVFVRQRAGRARPAPLDDESELQRLAEGQAAVVEIVRRRGPIDLAGVASLWQPPPAPPDLADWVAALLTDGSLDATFGPDGVARFCLPRSARPSPSVTVDLSEFDRAQLRREALAEDPEEDDR